MSRKDFVPDSYKSFHDWSENYRDQATEQLTGLTGWDKPRIDALKAHLNAMTTAAQAVLDAQKALDDAVGTLGKAKTDHLPVVRTESTSIKTSPGYDDGIGEVLEIVAGGSSFDPAGYKPIITAESLPGLNRLSTKKRGVDSENIYLRRKGDASFKLIFAKRVRFPVDDDTPPLVAGQTEVREYQFRGVIGDDEVGQPSDIVAVTFTP